MPRAMTDEEKKWLRKFKAILKQKPRTCDVFADGTIKLVDTIDLQHQDDEEWELQSIGDTGVYCDGGDPWKAGSKYHELDDGSQTNPTVNGKPSGGA